MAENMDMPVPGMAAAGAMRSKAPAKAKGACDSVTIRRAGNGFIVEKTYEGGGPMEKPEVAPDLDAAMALGVAALGGAAAATAAEGEAPMAPPAAAGPDALGGAEAESGMPGGAPPERPGVRYDEAAPMSEEEEEPKY